MKKLLITFLLALISISGFAQLYTPANAATGTDTYAATVSSTVTSYNVGQSFLVRFTNANTGAATLNINGIGAKSIKKNVSAALAAGDIQAGQEILLKYDGTNLQVVGGGSGSGSVADAINDGVTTVAPSQNAVFDALATKASTSYADGKVADAINDGTTTIAPSQNAVYDALALKAPLASPTFTGTPAGPTPSAGTNTTQFATTAFVTTATPNASPSTRGLAKLYTSSGTNTDGTMDQNSIKNYVSGLIQTVFNVYTYGCVADGQKVTDGAITSGAATLTSATGLFASGDVGKSIRVYGAGASGADLLTTIAGFTNSTTVTLTANASTTVSSRDVKWGTDNGPCIQSTINAAFTNGGGVVYLPYVPGRVYGVYSPFVTSVDGVNPNCQIYIPKLNIGSQEGITIEIRGEIASNAIIGGNSAHRINTNGVIIESMIPASGTAPAVIGASFSSSGGGGVTNFTHTDVFCNYLTVKTKSKTGASHVAASVTAIDFSKVAAASLTNVMAVTESANYTESVQPTDANCAGIKLPGRLNTSDVRGSVNDCYASGYYTGFELVEHTHCNNIVTSACVDGIAFLASDNHPSIIQRYFCDGAIHPIAIRGTTTVQIPLFEFEASNSAWFNTTNHIYAASPVTVQGYVNYISQTTLSTTNNFGQNFVVNDLSKGITPLRVFVASSTYHSLTFQTEFGTNVAEAFQLVPKGTGASASLKTQLSLHNRFYDGVGADYERLDIRAAGTTLGYTFNADFGGSGTAARPISFLMGGTTALKINTTGDTDLTGSLTLTAAGNRLKIKEGSNAAMGVATLVAGTVTVSNTSVTANSRIWVQRQTDGGTVAASYSITRSAGTNFTITAKDGSGSNNTADTSVIAWHIIEPAP